MYVDKFSMGADEERVLVAPLERVLSIDNGEISLLCNENMILRKTCVFKKIKTQESFDLDRGFEYIGNDGDGYVFFKIRY